MLLMYRASIDVTHDRDDTQQEEVSSVYFDATDDNLRGAGLVG